MNDEQMKLAKIALRDYHAQQLRKRIMLRLYRLDQEKASRWRLPFKLIHDANYIPGECPASDYYPHLSDVGIDDAGNPCRIPDAKRITPETALYYFTRILAYHEADLRTYGPADWTGVQIPTYEAEEQLQGYLARVEDFRLHPEQYDQGPHPLQIERYFISEAL